MANGKVLVVGGCCVTPGPYSAAAEIYDPATNSWHLRTGKVLAAGGDNLSTSLSTAELYTPPGAPTAYATPNPVKKGAVLTIAGSGFQAGETVQLSYKGAVYASAVAAGSGTFSVNFTTSSTAAKNYIGAAKGLTSADDVLPGARHHRLSGTRPRRQAAVSHAVRARPAG